MKTLRNMFFHKRHHIDIENLCYEEGILSDHQEIDVFEEINKGAFGTVYKGSYHLYPSTKVIDVAVKEIKGNKPYYDEIRNLIELKGEKEIVHFYNYCKKSGRHILITELCKGGDMISYLIEKGPLPHKEAAQIIRWLLSAVQKCHAHGICHNDIKLDNIGILRKGDLSELRLLDFGNSKRVHEGPFLSNTLMGSPHYIAPELWNTSKLYEEKDLFKVDIWCVGVVLFTLIKGFYPFEPSNKKLHIRALDLENIPESFKDLLKKLLNPCPEERITASEALKHYALDGNVQNTRD